MFLIHHTYTAVLMQLYVVRIYELHVLMQYAWIPALN